MNRRKLERRDFLKISVAGERRAADGIQFPGISGLAVAQSSRRSRLPRMLFMPNAFVPIGSDERVTVIVESFGDGAGRLPLLPMLLGDELVRTGV